MTVQQALTWARNQLAPYYQDYAFQARLLLAQTLNVTQAQLIKEPQQPLDAKSEQLLQDRIEQRIQGVPLAYVLGSQSFWCFDLQVSYDVLIPRPDTEILVEWLLNYESSSNPVTVLDLGTGSGAIALALAYERPSWQIIGSDQSWAALEIAKANAQRYSLDQIAWFAGDWLQACRKRPYFDIIVSNPPYVALNDPDDETSGYEPKNALLAQDNGLSELNYLAQEAFKYIKPGGCLLMEHGSRQGGAVRQMLLDNGWQQVATLKDWSGWQRASYGFQA